MYSNLNNFTWYNRLHKHMSKEFEGQSFVKEPGKLPIHKKLVGRIADKLANNVDADVITGLGAALGVAGSYLLTSPEDAINKMRFLTHDKVIPTKLQVRVAGGVALGLSYFCDILDGDVARKSAKGPTKYGTVFDGVVDKTVDTSPALFLLSSAKTLDERLTWLAYMGLAPISSGIRSTGIAHDIPIPKTGLGARIGRIPVMVSALLFKNKRTALGKVLVLQLVADSIHRYKQIVDSGNTEAVDEVNSNLAQHLGLFILGQLSSEKTLPKSMITLGLELAKFTQIKMKEVYPKVKT